MSVYENQSLRVSQLIKVPIHRIMCRPRFTIIPFHPSAKLGRVTQLTNFVPPSSTSTILWSNWEYHMASNLNLIPLDHSSFAFGLFISTIIPIALTIAHSTTWPHPITDQPLSPLARPCFRVCIINIKPKLSTRKCNQ